MERQKRPPRSAAATGTRSLGLAGCVSRLRGLGWHCTCLRWSERSGSFSIGRLALYVFQRLFVKAEIVAELVEYGKAHLFADGFLDRATFLGGHGFRMGFDALLVDHDAVRTGIRAEKASLGARRAFKDAHQQIVRVAPLGSVVFDHHGNVLNVPAELPREGIHGRAHQLKERLAPHKCSSLIAPAYGRALTET